MISPHYNGMMHSNFFDGIAIRRLEKNLITILFTRKIPTSMECFLFIYILM